MKLNHRFFNRSKFTLASGVLVAVFASLTLFSAVTVSPTPAEARKCVYQATHWGRMAKTRRVARRNARAGMAWKVYVLLDAQPRGFIHIVQCKRRDNGLWQCQARQRVNRCS